jgi:hypothetical protein
VNGRHCAGILSTARPERVVLVDERVEGFFLERLNDLGELVRTTQHDTMDEAMQTAHSEYELSEWRACPDGINPLNFIEANG